MPEAIVPRGLVESVSCMHYARFGTWPDQFLDLVRRYYGGRIPQRCIDRAATLKRERPWWVEDPCE